MRSTVGVGSVLSTSRLKKENEVFLRCAAPDSGGREQHHAWSNIPLERP